MKIGFTGTRAGMSVAQASQLQLVVAWLRQADQKVGRVTEFHDGDCPDGGADQEARALAVALGCVSVLHQPRDSTARVMLDRDIAIACSVLVVAPRTDKEELRSGTWATVRYARKAGKPIVMLSRGSDVFHAE